MPTDVETSAKKELTLLKKVIPLSFRNYVRLALKLHPHEYRLGWPDLETIDFARGDIVFDVGANIGSFVECVLAYQPWAAVHAFEPRPEAFGVLNLKFSEYPAVYCNNLALGSKNSIAALNVSRYDQASSFLKNGPVLDHGVYGIDFDVTTTIDVQVETLASYASKVGADHIRLLKLDVQGYELEVLKGAEPVLSTVDYIYAEAQFQELYIGGPRFTDLFDFLSARGHELMRMTAFRSDDSGRLMECDMIFKNRTLTRP